MAPRRKANRKADGLPRKRAGKRPRRPDATGLYVLRVDSRVMVDVIVPADGEVLAFIRVDGELLAELPVLGQA
jgi:hypothetical protein